MRMVGLRSTTRHGSEHVASALQQCIARLDELFDKGHMNAGDGYVF